MNVPRITLRVRATNRQSGLAQLEAATIDLAIGHYPEVKAWHEREVLFSERWVCVGCDCNRALPSGPELNVKEYSASPHLVVLHERTATEVTHSAMSTRCYALTHWSRVG